jgi:hypothetical protein
MLIFKLTLILMSSVTASALVPAEKDTNLIKLAEEVRQIVIKVYAHKSSIVNLIYNGPLEDFTNLVAQNVASLEKVSVTIEHSLNIHRNLPKRNLNVFLIDSVGSFRKIFNKMTTKTFDFHGYFTIVWINRQFRQTREVFAMMWQKQIYNVVVLSIENSSVIAQNFNPFSNESCSNMKPKKVRGLSQYFDQNLKDMNQCSLKAHAPNWAPFIFIDKDEKPAGRDFEFIKIIESYLNFKINLTILTEPAAWGMLFPNGTATGAIGNLLDAKTDMIVGDFYLRESRIKFLDPSAEYFNADIVFVVPPGRSIESIEKLLQPYSRRFWVCVDLSIFSFISVIVILNLWTKGVYKARLVKVIFKVIAIAFGVSTAHPRRSFHRILFASLTISCLVFTAAYQGSLYRFLEQDIKKKEVQSIEEMIESDFKFYSYDSMLEMIEDNSLINQRLITMPYSDFGPILKKLRSSSFEGTMVSGLNEILLLNQRNEYNFTFRKNFFIIPSINTVIRNLVSAGIVEHIHKRFLDEKLLSAKKPLTGPKVLTLEHMKGCFQLWACGCFVACICLVLEKCIAARRKKTPTPENFVVYAWRV